MAYNSNESVELKRAEKIKTRMTDRMYKSKLEKVGNKKSEQNKFLI